MGIRKHAVQEFRRKAADKGLVRLEVLVSSADKPLIKRLASLLSSQSDTAQHVRQEVDRFLSQSAAETGFDIFGSDLPDSAFDRVFEANRQSGWRATEI